MNNEVITQVIILSLIMMIGVFAKKKNIITRETNKCLSELLINITLPSLILTSFNYTYSEEMLVKAKAVFFYSLIVHLVLIVVSKIFALKSKEDSKKVLRFVTVFSNSAFMGYPVLEGLFGKIGIFYGAIFNIPFNMFMFSVGTMFYTGKKDIKSLKNVITNPGIISTVIGFTMFVFSIKLPVPVFKALNIVGSMTTSLSMMIVGVMLADVKLKEIFSGFIVYYSCFIRLIAAPIITFIILNLIHADKLLIQISVIIQAMPAAVLASVFAEKYGGDTNLAAKTVFITTIVSMFTIPIVVMFI